MVRYKNLGISSENKIEIIKAYNKNYCNFRDLVKEFGITTTSLCKILSEYKVPKRKIIRWKNPSISDEARVKLSKALTLAHSEGRHPGWTSVNSKKESSYPEKFFIDKFNINENLNKYSIVEKLQVSKYVLDFAILEFKINIEIDGQHHFYDEKTIKKDIIRNKFLIDNGWKVFRICWVNFKDKYESILLELNEFIKSNLDIRYDKYEYIPSRNYCKCGVVIEKTSKSCSKCVIWKTKFEVSKEELEQLIKEKPMTEIGKMFGVSDNAIRKRCKKLAIELKPMRGHWAKVRANSEINGHLA